MAKKKKSIEEKDCKIMNNSLSIITMLKTILQDFSNKSEFAFTKFTFVLKQFQPIIIQFQEEVINKKKIIKIVRGVSNKMLKSRHFV